VNDFAAAFVTAIDLIGRFDPHLSEFVFLSYAPLNVRYWPIADMS